MKYLLFYFACFTLAYADSGINNSSRRQGNVSWRKPFFCKNHECPIFDVLQKTEHYELRRYHPGTWVSTSIEYFGFPDKMAKKGMFWKLFRYIKGANQNNEKIDMTVPVITKITPGRCPYCKSTYTMSFYLEWRLQETAPQPTERGVFLTHLPEKKFYVRSFGGRSTKEISLDHAIELGVSLGCTRRYITDNWYTAGYDSPWTHLNRHNEVWLEAKNSSRRGRRARRW